MPPKKAANPVRVTGEAPSFEFSLRHSDVFGVGTPYPGLMKIKLCQIAERIQRLWGKKRSRSRPPDMQPSVWARLEFQRLTDMDHRRVREFLAEAKLNGGYVFDPVPRGMKPRRFNMEIEELREWIEQKVLEHREGNGLTAPALCRLLQAEYPVQCPSDAFLGAGEAGWPRLA